MSLATRVADLATRVAGEFKTVRTEISGKVAKSALPVNVKDYGAVGNGTSNDTVALNAAIAAAITEKRDVYWPAGTFYATGNLVGFHSVRHIGEGIVAPFYNGGNPFHITPGTDGINNIFVNASTGDDANDGISASRPIKSLQQVDTIIQRRGRALLSGTHTFRLTGTFTGGWTFAKMLRGANPVVFEGEPLVSGQPVTTINWVSGGSNFGMRFEPGAWVQLKNLKFTNFKVGFNGYGAIVKGGGDMYVLNCRAENCDTGFACVDQSVMGLYASTVTGCTTGVRAQYGTTATIGASGGLGSTISSCETGVMVSRNAVAHFDYSTVTDCTLAGLMIDMQSRVAMIAGTVHRNAVGVYVQGAAEWLKDPATDFGFGTANANTAAWRHRGAGHENRLHSQTTQVEWRAYVAPDATYSVATGTNTALILLGSSLAFPPGHFSEKGEQKLRVVMHGTLTGAGAKSIAIYKTDPSGAQATNIGFINGFTQAGEFTCEIEIWPTGPNSQMYSSTLNIEGTTPQMRRGTSAAVNSHEWRFRVYAHSGDTSSTLNIDMCEFYITG